MRCRCSVRRTGHRLQLVGARNRFDQTMADAETLQAARACLEALGACVEDAARIRAVLAGADIRQPRVAVRECLAALVTLVGLEAPRARASRDIACVEAQVGARPDSIVLGKPRQLGLRLVVVWSEVEMEQLVEERFALFSGRL